MLKPHKFSINHLFDKRRLNYYFSVYFLPILFLFTSMSYADFSSQLNPDDSGNFQPIGGGIGYEYNQNEGDLYIQEILDAPDGNPPANTIVVTNVSELRNAFSNLNKEKSCINDDDCSTDESCEGVDCNNPEIINVRKVIFIEGDAELDLTELVNESKNVLIRDNVSIVSNRGQDGSEGALLHLSESAPSGSSILQVRGKNCRLTGLRFRGELEKTYSGERFDREIHAVYAPTTGLEFDNCEVFGFSGHGVYGNKPEGTEIHHNHLHYIRGYAVDYGTPINPNCAGTKYFAPLYTVVEGKKRYPLDYHDQEKAGEEMEMEKQTVLVDDLQTSTSKLDLCTITIKGNLYTGGSAHPIRGADAIGATFIATNNVIVQGGRIDRHSDDRVTGGGDVHHNWAS